MTITLVELNTLVQQKIEADSEFQSQLADLSEEEKTARQAERMKAEMDNEIQRIGKDAENYKAQKIRAEKAEKELKSEKAQVKPDSLSPKDYLALTSASVNPEDFDEISDFATFRKISIGEALKNKTLQLILSERAEERATELATAARARRPAQDNEARGEALIAKARLGELPDSDEGIEKLVSAEMEAKTKH